MNRIIPLVFFATIGFSCSPPTQRAPAKSLPCKVKSETVLLDSLIASIRDGDLSRVKFYVENKDLALSDCDSKGHDTPLTASVHYDKKEIFEYLISKGADPKGRDSWGTPSCVAALYGRDFLLKRLLELGVSPNEMTNRGSPLLSFAVSEARYSTAKILLESGADKNQINEDGDRPIDRARRQKDDKMIELLNSF